MSGRPDLAVGVDLAAWLLTAGERGNPCTEIDQGCPPGTAWTTGNEVRALVDGRAYFADLVAAVGRMRAGDLLLFTDWRGDPDERLDGPDTEVAGVFAAAARRGVVVKGLVWRSHLDRLRFSEAENRHLGERIEAAGGECLLDMRVRAGGSHHQKFVVLRHPGRPELDVVYLGGIDLCHGRCDDTGHTGDPQPVAMASAYGRRPPWHDVQVAVRGPAVDAVETVFRERWSDPTPLSRNPLHRLADLVRGEDTRPGRLPARLPDPQPCGPYAVQLLRTYPYRRRGYPFAPQGERSVARGYCKAVARARRLIYLEDQYLWSPQVADCFARALADNPALHLIVVVPRVPDSDGLLSGTPQLVGRARALATLRRAGGERVHAYSPENRDGVPVYVHAKVCVVDDVWATVGSDNLSRRSWTHDSELTCAVVDPAPGTGPDRPFPLALRLRLAREHLDRADGHDEDLVDPDSAVRAFAFAAAALDDWYAGGCRGPRPPGRLRPYRAPELSWWTRCWATPLYLGVHDPDGRPRRLRRRGAF